MNRNKVYCCYSAPLLKYLTEEFDLKYDVVGLNPNSNKKFWGFVKTKKLDEALQMWGKYKEE